VIGSRLHRCVTLALFVAAVVATVVYWHRHPHEPPAACAAPAVTETTLAEVLWYAFGALLLLLVPRIVAVRRRVTRAQAWMLGLGIGGMVLAQIADRPELTFPFIRWDMFARPAQPQPKVVGYRLEAIARDGSRHRLSMIDLYSFPGWRVATELSNLARRVEQQTTCHRDRDAAAGERKLHALVQRIGTLVPDATTIDIVRITWPGDGEGLGREERSVRWSVTLDAERAR